MNATYQEEENMLCVDAGSKMDLEEIGEFVHFMLLFVNPKSIDVRQNVEENNRTRVYLELDKKQAETLRDKLQLNCEI